MAPSCMENGDMTATYIITDPASVAGTLLASTFDGCTGIETAHFRYNRPNGGYFSVPLGVPLCHGCDAHAPDGVCKDCGE